MFLDLITWSSGIVNLLIIFLDFITLDRGIVNLLIVVPGGLVDLLFLKVLFATFIYLNSEMLKSLKSLSLNSPPNIAKLSQAQASA